MKQPPPSKTRQGLYSRGGSKYPIALSPPENKYFDAELFFLTFLKGSQIGEVDKSEDFKNSICLLLLRLVWPPKFSNPDPVQGKGKPND